MKFLYIKFYFFYTNTGLTYSTTTVASLTAFDRFYCKTGCGILSIARGQRAVVEHLKTSGCT